MSDVSVTDCVAGQLGPLSCYYADHSQLIKCAAIAFMPYT